MIKLSDFIMNFLADRGVKHVFMLPGGGAMHLDDSLGRCEALTYSCFFHEQSLAIAVEAYGQHTNTPGVGLVTSGPGSTNAITGVAAAYIDSTPAFFLSGQAKRPDLMHGTGVRQMGSQEVDIVSMVSCVTKYAVTILEPETIRFHLEKAWHLATTGRMGPVWLDIPLDVQAAMIDEEKLKGFTPEPEEHDTAGLAQAVDDIAELLNASKRPLILAGNGVKLADAQDELISLAENNRIPVLLTWKAIDYMDYDHPLNYGSPGIMGSRYANFMVQNCDLLLVIGSRLEPSVTAFNHAGFAKNARKVMVDIDAAEIRKIAHIDIPITADAGNFLRVMNAAQPRIEQQDRRQWTAYCQELKRRYPVVLDEYRDPRDNVNLYVFTEELFDQLRADDVVVPESSGAAGEVTYQAIKVKKGQLIKNAAGLGSMGFGLPYSIGACLANECRRTVLINGDGAFQLNIQELETVKRLGLPIKIFIWCNDGYASIRQTQTNMFDGFFVGSGTGSGLSMPDIAAIAAAYGLRTVNVETNEGLQDAIAETLAGDDPVLCCVHVTANHVTAPKVQAMRLPEGGMVSKPLEDMWPFLPPEELAENMIAEKKNQ